MENASEIATSAIFGWPPILVATVILVAAYFFIITEKINRAIVSLLGAGLLVLLGVLNFELVINGIDFNTIFLLTGMMVIVAITKESGVFQFVAIYTAKLVKANPRMLLIALAVVTAVFSALLDNVTTVLLVVPVTLLLTDQLKLRAYPFLFSQIFASNIGGTATLIGDPPNILIGSAVGLSFMDFVEWVSPIAIIVLIVCLFIFDFIWGREDYLRYWKSAIEEGGPECDAIGSFAARNKAYIVTGVIEREGGTLFCSVFFFGPDGHYLGKHRKLMPTASERLIWGQGDGSHLRVFDTPLGKLSTAICWENYMPSLRQTLYAKGVKIWCAPTVDQREIWQSSMRHIAYEGRTFVLNCCQYMTRADAPEVYDCIQGNDPDTILIRGGSCIISPLGEVLVGPVYDKEAVLTAEIDLDDVVRGKYDLDVSGHYARPDIFQLDVNEAPMVPVSFHKEAPSCAPSSEVAPKSEIES